MLKQYRTFYSALLLILLSTAVVMFMYTHTINTSLEIVKDDIQENNLSKLRLLASNLDHNVEQLNMLAIALEIDSKVRLLPSIDQMDHYDQTRLILDLTGKMNLQSFSHGWSNRIVIYSHLLEQWIGITTDQSPPPDAAVKEWEYDPTLRQFTTYRRGDGYTIRLSFPHSNIQVILDGAKLNNNDPFFYDPGSHVIMNRYSDRKKIDLLLTSLTPLLSEQIEGTAVITVDNSKYMVNFLRSDKLGWYMVDYVPLEEALQPIVRTQTFFYTACFMLFLTGLLTVVFLYRKVQVPIVTLLRGVRMLRKGEFSHRIQRESRNEFDILYQNFNEMAAQIEELIENVYKEKIIAREALVKQLQAQINPHFLYNCLFFINNMNRLGNDEAVTAMTKNLAEYFRYTTRLDEPLTTLEKEIGVVENYLTIQCLRMDRLRYEIQIPDSMKQLSVPKLLIQPLVENSVIHGIERKQNAGFIRIIGVEEQDSCFIYVEDDGAGMSEADIQTLLERIAQPLDDTMGCALWNINQRIHIHFHAPAGMRIESSSLGGLRVTLYWSKKDEGGQNHVPTADRR